MNILEEIAGKRRQDYEARRREITFAKVRQEAEALAAKEGEFSFPFYRALKKPSMSFICEVKKASPSKGLIAPDFPYLEIAKEYEAIGAAAISCLTEPHYFLGSDQYLKEITDQVSIPVLRKDFTVDPYQIFEAKLLGASAILLIVSLLDDSALIEYSSMAKSLGLSVLVECHDEEEVDRAIRVDAKIIGVNNRNLKDFTVDINNSVRLRNLVPEEIAFVSESGVKTGADVQFLYENKTDAVLIGETLMRSSDKKATLDSFRA